MRPATGLLAVLALAAGAAGATAATLPEKAAVVVHGPRDRALDQYMSRLEALGFSGGLAVVTGGETVLLKGYGKADRECGVPMGPDSVFNLGSITKPFTAAAVLRLQELGKLKTGDPIGRFLDGVPGDKAGITLEHLLTHTSGLESDFSPTDYEPTTREEYVGRALASKLLFAPGQGYEAALAELVLKPAGLTQTGYKAPQWAEARVAHGYFRPRVVEGPGARSHYAFGWAVEKTPHGTLVQHNGGNGIYVAELLRFVDEGVMIFLASTVAEMKATPAVPVLAKIVFGEPYDLPHLAAALPPESLRARAGRYRAPSGAEIEVHAVEGGLEVAASEPAGFALLAGVPAAQRERYARLETRTADITGRAFKGDPTGVHEAFGGRLGLEDVRQREAQLMRDREERLGPYRGYAVVGSVPRGEGRVETAVRVDFERGSVYNRFVWGPRDGLLGIQAGPEPPGARYVPVSETAFVSFRLGDSGPQRRLSFEGDGSSTVLVVPGPDGPQRLPRQP